MAHPYPVGIAYMVATEKYANRRLSPSSLFSAFIVLYFVLAPTFRLINGDVSYESDIALKNRRCCYFMTFSAFWVAVLFHKVPNLLLHCSKQREHG